MDDQRQMRKWIEQYDTKIYVKHRSDFEVIFQKIKTVTCDFLNRTDTAHAGRPIITDDECEQIGVRYDDQIFTVVDSACYKILRTWTLGLTGVSLIRVSTNMHRMSLSMTDCE